jgi:hypothetical protein
VGNAIAESSQPSEERREKNMANLVGRGFTGFCARFAYGFVSEQVLMMFAPLYLLRPGRARRARHSIDLYASRVGRS